MIGIVGGGISGLLLLHFLIEAGLEAILFERSPTPGGVMQSRTLDGPNGPVVVDLGPQRMRLTAGLSALLDTLELEADLRAPKGLPFTIYHEGRLHPAPLSLGDALRTPLISFGGKLRALADLITPAPRRTEELSRVLERKLGTQVYRRLAGPIFGGLYASDPREMEARHTLLPVLARAGSSRSLLLGLLRASRRGVGTPVVSFEHGMGTLPQAIAERYRHRIRLADPVEKIVPSGTRFRIETNRSESEVEQVVLATTAGAAAESLLLLSPSAAHRIGSLRYNPLAIVPLVVPRELGAPRTGSGFKMTLDDRSVTRGVTAHDALFGREGLFTAFLGGMGAEDVVDRPDVEIMELARRDFERVTGTGAVPLLAHRTAMPAWDRTWSALDGLELPKGVHLCTAFSHRPGILGRYEQARRLADRLGS